MIEFKLENIVLKIIKVSKTVRYILQVAGYIHNLENVIDTAQHWGHNMMLILNHFGVTLNMPIVSINESMCECFHNKII